MQDSILGGNNTVQGLGSGTYAHPQGELPQPFLFVAVLTTMTSSRRWAADLESLIIFSLIYSGFEHFFWDSWGGNGQGYLQL